MDQINDISSIISGVPWEKILLLLGAAVGAAFIASLSSLVLRRIRYSRLISNKHFSIGTKVLHMTPISIDEGVIEKISTQYILIDCDRYTAFVTPEEFLKRWYKLKQ